MAFVIWGRVEEWRLDRALDAVEARGEPLDLAAFDPAPETEEQRRASHYYAEAMRLTADAPGAQFDLARRAAEALCSLPAADPRREPHQKALENVEQEHAAALQLLDRATALDSRGWDEPDKPKSGDGSEVFRRRRIVAVNAVRIARLACTGASDAAAALLATLRLRRALPMTSWIPVTTHSLESLLTFTTPDPEILHELQQEYTALADDRMVEKRQLLSRAQWLAFLLPGELSDAPARHLERRIAPTEAAATALIRPLRVHAVVTDLDEYRLTIDAARQPWPAKLDIAAALARKYGTSSAASPNRRGLFTTMYRPYGSHFAARELSTHVAAAAESLARTRASIAALAIARYRAAHDGTLPGSLTNLIPAFLEAPLVDSYTGRELIYRPESGGYKVYSVGIDRYDDGGVWDMASDLQMSRRGNPKDVGVAVRVWSAAGAR